jgi:hypothetical protein
MVSRNVYVEFQKGTPPDPATIHGKLHSLWIQYCSGKKVACNICTFLRKKKVVDKHMEFVQVQLMQGYQASA